MQTLCFIKEENCIRKLVSLENPQPGRGSLCLLTFTLSFKTHKRSKTGHSKDSTYLLGSSSFVVPWLVRTVMYCISYHQVQQAREDIVLGDRQFATSSVVFLHSNWQTLA